MDLNTFVLYNELLSIFQTYYKVKFCTPLNNSWVLSFFVVVVVEIHNEKVQYVNPTGCLVMKFQQFGVSLVPRSSSKVNPLQQCSLLFLCSLNDKSVKVELFLASCSPPKRAYSLPLHSYFTAAVNRVGLETPSTTTAAAAASGTAIHTIFSL